MSRPAELAVRVSLVVAVAENGVIGRGGGLPWHLPDDLRHFKAVTLGKAVLMGRRTFESIGRALPGRRNLVMSHTGSPATSAATRAPASPPSDRREPPLYELAASANRVEYVGSVEEACARVARSAGGAGAAGGAPGTGDPAELCVIGGAQVYALALPYATRIHLTCVHAAVEGDVYFPGAPGARGAPGVRGARFAMPDGWREVERIEHAADARHAYAMSFVTLER
jgi:dihydrofolate reductase